MRKELAKTYAPKEFEDRIYHNWEEKGYFHAEIDPKKKPYTIVIPPPNITGQLHMGHALDNTLQDILIRWRRMQGYSALWLPGNDMRWTETKVTNSRNFANKLWNASRYILMNLPEDFGTPVLPENLPIEDKWVLSLFNDTVKNVTSNLEAFELGVAVQNLTDFIWDVYCDWYIELTKPRIAEGGESALAAQNVLVYIMQGILKLLHPFMPFITEEIWQSMPGTDSESIMIAKWCEYDEKLHFGEAAEEFSRVVNTIKAIRVQRNELNVPPSKKVTMTVETQFVQLFTDCRRFFEKLAGAGEFTVTEKVDSAEGMMTVVTDSARVFMPMGELVDKDKELARLDKEKKAAEKDIEFLSKKLNNPGFLAKAPAQQIENERAKLAKAEEKLAKINASIEGLK